MAEPAAHSEFRVGAVLGQSLRVLTRNFVPFLAVALLLVWPGEMAIHLSGLNDYFAYGELGFSRHLPSDQRAAMMGISVFGSVLSCLVVAALTVGTVQYVRGHRAGIVPCLWAMLSCLPTVVGVALLSNLVVIAGLALFVVPGIVAFLMLWLALPIAVVEQTGVIESLKRSAAMTRGHRWRILGLVMIGFAVFVLAALISVSVAEMLDTTIGSPIGNVVVGVLNDAVLAMIFGVLAAVSYVHLLALGEGGSIGEVAAVFD